jgi:outer membrane protein insertion porin family
MRHLVLAIVLAVPAALAQRPVVAIAVTGTERFTPAAVIAASGLHVGQTVVRNDLNAAAQRLLDTGFFSSVNYRYDFKTICDMNGFAVTLQIAEEPAPMPVELDIPGQDSETLWPQLQSAAPFIGRRMPGNDRASAYYKRAIENLLAKSNHPQEIAIKTEADVPTRQSFFICRPAHLPKVAIIRFSGNAAISSDILQAHLAKVAMGQESTERDFRRMLELNIRPLYEELGRLTVAFPHVQMVITGDSAAVTTEVVEGPVWHLDKVDLAGDRLPEAEMRAAAQFEQGRPANWKLFLASVSNMEQVLRRDGYIQASSKATRSYREADRSVDVRVDVQKGRQFFFGELQVHGLDPGMQQRVAGQWKLASGAPMNELYIRDFIKAVAPVLAGKIKSSRTDLRPREGTNVVDVVLTFR